MNTLAAQTVGMIGSLMAMPGRGDEARAKVPVDFAKSKKIKKSKRRVEPHGRRWRPVLPRTRIKRIKRIKQQGSGESEVAIRCRFFDSFDCLICVAGKMPFGCKIAEIKQIKGVLVNQVHAAVWRGNQTNSRVPSPSNQKFFDSV